MKCVSNLNGELYESEDCHYFKNYIQAAYYYKWNCKLIDLDVGTDMKWIFAFKKSDHEKVKDKWIEHCEEYKRKQEENKN